MNRAVGLALALSGLFLVGFVPLPGQEPELVKPNNLVVNTDKDEDEPHLSSNGLTLHYASNAKGKWDILVSRRPKTTMPWPAGKSADVNSKADTRSAFLTTDGQYPQRLYFATNKNLEKKDQKGNNFDLYWVTKQGAQADYTFETGFPHCTADDEMHPWVTAQGQLYFSRKTKDGWRTFVSTRPAGGGQLAEPKPLDLPPNFHHATLTPDGKTMYLQGPLEEKEGKTRWGLFRTTRTGTGWARPEPLAMLNSPDAPTGDRSPALSREGSLLYFASDRPGGKGGLDLWVIPTAQLVKKAK